MCVSMSVYLCEYECICVCICVSINVNVCVCQCMCVCVSVYVSVCVRACDCWLCCDSIRWFDGLACSTWTFVPQKNQSVWNVSHMLWVVLWVSEPEQLMCCSGMWAVGSQLLSLCTHMGTHTHGHAHTRTHAHTHTHTHMGTHTHTHMAYTHTHTHIQTER